MSEREIARERRESRRPLLSFFGTGSPAGGGADAGTATVIHGVHLQELPVAGRTVAEIRERFGDRLGIDPESRAVLRNREVDEDTIVRTGEVLSFIRRAGEKGGPLR